MIHIHICVCIIKSCYIAFLKDLMLVKWPYIFLIQLKSIGLESELALEQSIATFPQLN